MRCQETESLHSTLANLVFDHFPRPKISTFILRCRIQPSSEELFEESFFPSFTLELTHLARKQYVSVLIQDSSLQRLILLQVPIKTNSFPPSNFQTHLIPFKTSLLYYSHAISTPEQLQIIVNCFPAKMGFG